jgi:hypothetical protein
MTKYLITQIISHKNEIIIEANSIEEAIELAEETDFDSPDYTYIESEIDYTGEEVMN